MLKTTMLKERQRREQIKRWRAEMRYLGRTPRAVPPDQMLVHNHVRRIDAWHPPRLNGFRIWLSPRGTRGYAVCGCGWAPELKRHYLVRLPRRKVLVKGKT
jgi:hypothetical protein